MKEIICISIGQAGVQLSQATWELFCVEHCIEANGCLKENPSNPDNRGFRTFFQDVPNGQFVPRTIITDLEPTVIDEIRTGPYKGLFHPDQLLSSVDDGCSNFARGYFSAGKKQMDYVAEIIRKLVDACETLQGFFVSHSVSGGTGSGFSALIYEHMSVEYSKRHRFQTTVFPNPQLSTAVTEPFNAILNSTKTHDITDMSCIMDNEAIFSICANQLDIQRPTFNNLNRVISQVYSDVTVSLRFESSLNADLNNMCTNVIPYPAIHYPVVCHAPLLCNTRASHDSDHISILTKSLFENKNQMVTCDFPSGKYMCCVIQYRGNITPKEVNESIYYIKRKSDVKFVDWCPTGFKLGVNLQPPTRVPSSEIAPSDKSVTMLANSTCVKSVWQKVIRKFDVLFSKRSFVHWFVAEGMEEGEFNEAREQIGLVVNDYADLELEEAPDAPPEDEMPTAGGGGMPVAPEPTSAAPSGAEENYETADEAEPAVSGSRSRDDEEEESAEEDDEHDDDDDDESEDD